MAGVGRFWTLVLLLAILPAVAQAQDARALELDGVEGVWLPLPEARLALQARQEASGLRERIRLLEDALELAGREVDTLRRAVTLGQEAEGALREALEDATQARLAAEAGRRVAEADRDAWWRSPVLWGGLGLAVGVVVTALVAATL